MAISARTTGTWETAAANASSYQFAIPTHQSGDLLLLRSFIKPSNGTSPATISPSIDQDWTIIANGYTYTNVSGNGTGSLYAVVAYKIATSSSETGPTLTFGTTTSPAEGVIDSWQKGSGEGWTTPVAIYKGFTATSSISVTMDSNPGVTAGDMCVAGFAQCDNNTLTSPTFTQSGVTFATVAEWPATANSSATGNDIDGDGCYRLASSGTATAAPVLTCSASASDEGIVSFTRLRVSVATSVNAGLASTTATAYGATFSVAPTAGVAAAAVATEFGAAYSATILADSPVAYWRLGEASGTTADNAEGTAALDGTYVNTPTLGVAGALTGDADTAVTFVRTSSEYVTVTDNAAIDVGDGPVSIEAWVKRADTSLSEYHAILSKGRVGTGDGSYTLQINQTTGYLEFAKSGNNDIVISDVGITDTNWHHVVATRYSEGTQESRVHYLYLDGVDVTDRATEATVVSLVDNNLPLLIGADNWSDTDGIVNHFDGSLDEVAVYATALSSTQVTAHYTAGTSGGGGSVGATANVGAQAGLAATTAAGLDVTATTSGSTNFTAELASTAAAAYGTSAGITPTAGIATASATAPGAIASIAPNAATSTATAAAYATTWQPVANPAALTAAATDAVVVLGANAGLAAATVGAYDATASTASTVYADAGLAAAAATALGASELIAPNADVAATTATAYGSTAAVGANAAAGAATATAHDATASTASATYANAGLAGVTVAALAASEVVGPNAGVAATVATALGATATTEGQTSATAGLAAVGATAYGAVAALGANAAQATVTAAGLAATATTATTKSVDAGLATATAAANAATVRTTASPTAGLAAGTATAYGATFAGASTATADAGLATVGATALPVVFHVLPAGGIATATGEALPGSVSIASLVGTGAATATAYAAFFNSTSNLLAFAEHAAAVAFATGTRCGHTGGQPPWAHGRHPKPRGDAALAIPVGTASHPRPEV